VTPEKSLRRNASSITETLTRQEKFVFNEVASERLQWQTREHLINTLVRMTSGPAFGLRRCEHIHSVAGSQIVYDGDLEGRLQQQTSSPSPGAGAAEFCEECQGIEEDQARVAGWLCLDNSSKAVSRAMRGASNLLGMTHDAWDRRYVVFDPDTSSFSLYKSMGRSLVKDREPELAISMASIEKVTPAAYKMGHRVRYALRVEYRSNTKDKSRKRSIQLKPIEDGDIDLASRWAALLLFRSGLYAEDIDALARITHRGITMLQRRVRIVVRANLAKSSLRGNSSKRHKSSHSRFFPNILRPLFTRHESANESDPDLDEDNYPRAESSMISNGIARTRSTQTTQGNQVPNNEASRWVPPLAEGEEEDEIWENQRWSFIDLKDRKIRRGWSHDSLLPQERQPFSNRTGQSLGADLYDMENLPVPPGWEISTPFIVDTSGMGQSRCDAEGWRYESQFNALDSKQAKGAQRGQANARWVVRHRRWYRRRRPIQGVMADEIARSPSWIAKHGWIGMRGMSTGRFWKSRYSMLVLPDDFGPAKNSVTPRPGNIGVAFWAYFAGDFEGHGAVCNLYNVDWSAISEKALHIKPLDRSCMVSDKVATFDNPGYFELHLSGESKPRLLNAETRENRMQWVHTLRTVIAASQSASATAQALQNYISLGDDDASHGAVERTGSISSSTDGSSLSHRDLTLIPKSASKRSHARVDHVGVHTIKQYLKRLEEDSGSSMPDSTGSSPTAALDLSSLKNRVRFGTGQRTQSEDPQSDVERSMTEVIPPRNTGEHEVLHTRSTPVHLASSSSSGGQFDPLENELVELSFNVDVDTLARVMFVEDEFQIRLDELKEYKNVMRTHWKSPSGEEKFCRGAESKSSYTMPKRGPVPETRAFATMTCVHAIETKGYQVDKSIYNPGLPYGKSFRTKLRFNLESESETSTRLVLSHEVKFLEQTVMSAIIRAASLRELRSSYTRSMTELENHLQRKNLAVPAALPSDDMGADCHSNGEDTSDEASAGGEFQRPEVYENVLVDEVVNVDVDTAHRIINMDGKFTRHMLKLDKVQDITITEWSKGSSAGSSCDLQYLMPRNGPVPKNTCYATWTLTQAVPKAGYQVDQEIRNPEVPYGKTFATLLRITIEAQGSNKSHLVVSHMVDFRQSTMMKGFIKSSSSREIKKSFTTSWFPQLKKFLANPGAQDESGDESADVETADKDAAGKSLDDSALSSEGGAWSAHPFVLYAMIFVQIMLVCFAMYMTLQVSYLREEVQQLRFVIDSSRDIGSKTLAADS